MPQATPEQVEAIQAEQAANNPANNAPQYVNDLTEADKEAIVKYVNENIQEIMAQPRLSTNNLCHLAQVSHGSIKSRGKNTDSAREIVVGVMNGTRAERQGITTETAVKKLEALDEGQLQEVLNKLLATQAAKKAG